MDKRTIKAIADRAEQGVRLDRGISKKEAQLIADRAQKQSLVRKRALGHPLQEWDLALIREHNTFSTVGGALMQLERLNNQRMENAYADNGFSIVLTVQYAYDSTETVEKFDEISYQKAERIIRSAMRTHTFVKVFVDYHLQF